MISILDRQQAVALIDEAVSAGARVAPACGELSISRRTYRRWVAEDGTVKADARPQAERPKPSHALSAEERERIVEVSCQTQFASLPPSQIVPKLADAGIYLASESTFYRVLRERKLQHHRGRAAAPRRTEPARHCARGANEIWTWDITWLPGPIAGVFFYLYLVLDLYSRKVVGWEVFAEENAEQAAQVIRKASLAEGRALKATVLHSDNGSPMKAATMLETLRKLGIAASFSRPGVSDDNAQVEAFFRTLKYRPAYPSKGFATVDAARRWVMHFVRWYNSEHQHSALKFVTPEQRHAGADIAVLSARHALYEKAKRAKPDRWSGRTRNWDHCAIVWLNPVRNEQRQSKLAA
jgi:transposase InsO family protein